MMLITMMMMLIIWGMFVHAHILSLQELVFTLNTRPNNKQLDLLQIWFLEPSRRFWSIALENLCVSELFPLADVQNDVLHPIRDRIEVLIVWPETCVIASAMACAPSPKLPPQRHREYVWNATWLCVTCHSRPGEQDRHPVESAMLTRVQPFASGDCPGRLTSASFSFNFHYYILI